MVNFLFLFNHFQESKKIAKQFFEHNHKIFSWFWTKDISRINHDCTPSLPCIQLTCWTDQICPVILPLFLLLSNNSWFWSWVFSMNMAWPGHQGLAGPSPFFLELPPGGDNLRTKILKHPTWSLVSREGGKGQFKNSEHFLLIILKTSQLICLTK